MKSVPFIAAVLCLNVGASLAFAQDDPNAPSPDIADTRPSLPDPYSTPDETDEAQLKAAANEEMQVLRIKATLEGQVTPLRAGQIVQFYQNATFKPSETVCTIAGMRVQPCRIYHVHGQQNDQVELALVVPQRLIEHIANITEKGNAKPDLFVRLALAPAPAEPPKTAARPASAEHQIKMFSLRHIKAADAERTISQLFSDDRASLAVDERTNSLIVRSEAERLAVIEAILLRLDSAPPATNGDANVGGPAAPAGQAARTRLQGQNGAAAVPGDVEALRTRFNALDARCLSIAIQLRGVKRERNNQDWWKKLDSDLADAVRNAFQARQQLQRAELAELQQRMQHIGQSIELRDRIADQIIRRRVEDLLNPNLKWTSSPAAEPAQLGQTGEPIKTQSFAEKVEADVAREEELRARLRGKWMLARTANNAEPYTIVIDGKAWHFFDPALKVVQMGTVRVNSPKSGRLVVEFVKDRYPRSTWMGVFELADDQLTIQFTSANAVGTRDSTIQLVDLEETLRTWSGVYHQVTTSVGDAASQATTASPLARAVQPVLAVLRGEDNKETRLARKYFDREWADDIDHIIDCAGNERLIIEEAWADDTTAFLVTSPVKEDSGQLWIIEILLDRQPDGDWDVVMIDDEPADNVKRDIDRFREECPDADPIQVLDSQAEPAKHDTKSDKAVDPTRPSF